MMAVPTQFTFTLREAAIALVKQQQLHDGKWLIGFEFGFGAGMFGQSPESVAPSAVMSIQKIQLTQATPEQANLPLVIDAAEVNPDPRAGERKTRKRALSV